MTDIHGFSALNISAISTSNSDEGILRDLPDHGFQLENCCRLDSLEPLPVSVGPPIEILDLEEKFLSTRGWVFQERLVSPATLHYTDEDMLWECASGIKLGHDQIIFNAKWKADWKTTMGRKCPDPSVLADAVRLDGATKNSYES